MSSGVALSDAQLKIRQKALLVAFRNTEPSE